MLVLVCLNINTFLCSQPRNDCLIYDPQSKLKVDCSFKELSKIPDSLPMGTVILDLRGNNIKTLPANVFSDVCNVTSIDLSKNLLSIINADALKGLKQLEILNLAGNKLCLPSSYPKGIFKDLTSLKVLKTFSNDCPTRHRNIPDDVFKDLVALEKLSLDATDNFTFGEGFTALKNLTHLEASSISDKCYLYRIQIFERSLLGLRNSKLTHLALRGCAFSSIDHRALSIFPLLHTVNFACANNLAGSLLQALGGLPNSSLQTLILDATDLFSTAQFYDQFCAPRFVNLQRLSLRGTSMLKKLNLHRNEEACLPHLHHLNLGQNLLFNIIVYSRNVASLLNHGIADYRFWSLTNIRTLDMSDLYGQRYSTTNNFCKNEEQDIEEYFRKVPEVIERIPNLDNFDVSSGVVKSNLMFNDTSVDPKKGLIASIMVSPGTQVVFANSIYAGQTWDLSIFERCPYTIYPPDTVAYFNFSKNNALFLKCPTIGIRSLRVLDASYCYGKTFHVDTFKKRYTPNLEQLSVRGNQLNNSYDFPEIFSEATTLKELDLSQNYIRFLPNNSFEHLINLRKLDLSNNLLKDTDIIISSMLNLNLLDLSYNLIPYLGKSFQIQLELISSHNRNLRLRLYGNPFSCQCESINFLDWLQNTNITVERVEDLLCTNSTTTLLKVDTKQISEVCNRTASYSSSRYFIIIGILGFIVFLAVVGSFVIYKQRWKIAWHMYTMKRRLFKNRYSKVEMDRKYDAYVAYYINHEVGKDTGITWVVNDLKDKAETEWNKTLFIFDRNAAVGGSKIREAIYGIQQSKKVLFVLTDLYVKSDLWEMVLYWAVRQGLGNIIMCCLEDMCIDKFPPELATVAIELQEKYPTHFLQFPSQTTCTRSSESTMWNKLKVALEEGQS